MGKLLPTIAFTSMAFALVPAVSSANYGCTGNGLCADAVSSCSPESSWRCGVTTQPESVVKCGKGTAENCTTDGDTILCGTQTRCIATDLNGNGSWMMASAQQGM
jgi:hypothetical protein